ncbi:glucan endo-1,3-beta-glucosidase-like [Populus alba x Populus x berolinensis]|nr:glucan endo-1,3-beta-glucosidase-like [Populus alba x Populus x berolinensis]
MDLPELWAIFGPGVAGAVFGAGWWFWIDAVVCSSVKVSVVHYLPGIFASIASLMFNCVRKEDIDYSPYEEGEWRLKLWLFFAYVVSFVSLAASVGLLIQDSIVKTGPSVWTGTAGILQCWPNLLGFILGMSYGDMCSLLELGIMTEGVGCKPNSNVFRGVNSPAIRHEENLNSCSSCHAEMERHAVFSYIPRMLKLEVEAKNKQMGLMSSMCRLILVTAITLAAHQFSISSSLPIGVCYGLNGNNLPPPSEVVGLYKRSGIEFIRLYEPRSDVLEALRGSGLAVALCPTNEDLANIAQRQDAADAWVHTNIAPYMSDVVFRWIILGNEVIPGPLASYVPAAIANTRNSLAAIGLANVTVTTTIPGNALEASYPPSAGAFRSDVTDVMIAVAGILASSGAPLMINVYPYFSYASNPSQVPVDYALFAATTPVVTDGSFLYYDLFDAMVDAFHAALERIGYPGLRVAIGESGWPSAGNDPYTSIDNAMIYNRNLVNHVLTNGTPRRPGEIMETFLFAMFNENLKPGAVEQNFGFFYPNMNPVYPFW